MGGFNTGQGLQGAAGGAAAGSMAGPWGTAIGAGLGGLLGGFSGGPKSHLDVPPELQGMQKGQVDLLQYLLPGAGGNAFSGIQNYFGNLGMPQSDLQRQSTGGISQFLNQPGPETQTLNTARPILEGMLSGTGPQFERDIALGNQQGARFGSANALMRGEAYKNLFNMRNQTAQTLGMLSGQAGQADFGRQIVGYGVGQQQAQQGDIGLQRMLNLFGGLFGARQQSTAGLPITQQPGIGTQLGNLGPGLGALGMMMNQGGGMKGKGGGAQGMSGTLQPGGSL